MYTVTGMIAIVISDYEPHLPGRCGGSPAAWDYLALQFLSLCEILDGIQLSLGLK